MLTGRAPEIGLGGGAVSWVERNGTVSSLERILATWPAAAESKSNPRAGLLFVGEETREMLFGLLWFDTGLNPHRVDWGDPDSFKPYKQLN